MVTIQNAVQYVNGVACTTQKIWCKSTDVKPTEGIGNGSQLREMDTGKDYAFDAENGEWLEQPSEGGGGGGGGGSSTLSGLTDVDISNPTNGQMLVYNATSGKWENGAGGGGGGGVLVVTLDADHNYLADKTCAEILSAIEGGGVLFRSNYSVLLLMGYGAEGDNYFFIVGEYNPATSGYTPIELYGTGSGSFPEGGSD